MRSRELATGLAVGIGLIAITPLILPVAAAMAGPLGRAAAKAGGVLYEKSRETFAELGEVMDDFIAEAKDEIENREEAPGATEPSLAEVSEETATESAGTTH